MAQTAFNYEIVERIAVLSQSGDTSKELNRVSYNGASPKYDIRSWRRTDGEEKLLKGLTLNEEEMEALKRAVELSGVDITPKSWIKPNREVLENATKREVKNFLTSVNNNEYEDDPLTKAIKEYMKETTLQTEQMRIDRESKEGGQGL